MSQLTIELPDKMSELIRVALEDLRKAEAAENVRIDMSVFHYPEDDGKCAVCFAGAVMRRVLPDDECGLTSHFKPATGAKLWALNELRCGCVSDAWEQLHDGTVSEAIYELDREVAAYAISRDQFHADMAKLADDLEAAGY